ncbi:hypothetical protein [Flavobacterium psychrotolerans]|uniref:Uncharacterized protein n=1 Tax=Flavobacterium psychrotolerans TaxID=2169410 RepID=A0A2U1JJA7_9FLAO|nr:hypothetical protein [Flavobacterium psychrotolerans]PWA05079.1 hypothetical protein DB895_08605 [Flavobacterium psychrotolerans]
MMRLKKIFLILFLIVGMQYSYCQIYKFQSTGFSVLEKNDKGDWGKWSDLQNTSLIITLDTNKNRIIIYSQEIQLYKIVNYETKQVSGDNEINAFTCSNDDGEPFVISIITRKNQGNRKQLYINQKKVIIVYNIVNFIDTIKK